MPGAGSLVILPTYDERATLPATITGIRDFLPGADVLVIDDASPDGTGEVAEAIAAESTGIIVQHRRGKLGLGTAYVQGFRHAILHGYRFAIEMDSDGSHRPRDLPELWQAATNGTGGAPGAGLVIGARWVPGGAIAAGPGIGAGSRALAPRSRVSRCAHDCMTSRADSASSTPIGSGGSTSTGSTPKVTASKWRRPGGSNSPAVPSPRSRLSSKNAQAAVRRCPA